MRALLIILALTFAASGLAQDVGDAGSSKSSGGAQSKFLPTEEAFQLEVEVLGDGNLRLYWQIAYKTAISNGTKPYG